MPAVEQFPIEIIAHLKSCRSVTVLTGAGISAESGVPTFREAQSGLWARFDPMQLATPQAFHKDPQLVWDWYTWRRELISASKPNPGHLALVLLEAYFQEFNLVTQNVDGMHQLAGSKQVVELHGNIFRTRCSRIGCTTTEQTLPSASLPLCPECGSYMRPDVVWFGESLPAEALQESIQAASSCDVFISVGTSSLIEPAASLPFIALQARANVLEINPQVTPLTQEAHFSMRGKAGEVLPALAAALMRGEGK